MTDEQSLSAMHKIVKEHIDPQTFHVAEGTVLVTPKESAVHDLEAILDKHLPQPKRAQGASKHETLDSLIAHAQRHKAPETAAFCGLTADAPGLVVIYNYTPADGTRGGWRDHRAAYTFPLSDEWTRWTAAAGRALTQREFAELLEAGARDVIDPALAPDPEKIRIQGVAFANPAQLDVLARGLDLRVDLRVTQQERLDNGTARLAYSETHSDDKGAPLSVPGGFVLAIPVFVGGARYAMPVRLRYKVTNGTVTWTIVLNDADACKRDAITDAATRFAAETKIPVFYGTPD